MVEDVFNLKPEQLPELQLQFDGDVPDDMQGIPWDRLPLERSQYRKDRMRQYENYTNVIKETRKKYQALNEFLEHEVPECLELPNKQQLFPFERNLSFLRTSIVHFQLRNLLCATAGHIVYAMHHNRIKQYNTVTEEEKIIMDLSGQTRTPFNLGQVYVSTMCAAHGFVAAGGFTGEVAIATSGGDHVWSHRVADEENCITNHMDIGPTTSGAVHVLASNNDMRLRLLHPETKTTVLNLQLPWASNCAVFHPSNRDMVALVADDHALHLYDLATGKQTQSFYGHLDWGFACAWHPGGHLLATGNQDCTTRLWDIRQPKDSIAVLPASIGAIRSCRFSPDGKYLACAEPIDFVHIYDVENGLTAHQDIDFFGEISGISFTPGSEMLLVGIPDQDYTSTLCFLRKDLHDQEDDAQRKVDDDT